MEKPVGDLLLNTANLDEAAQHALLGEVKPVFSDEDNAMMLKIPTKAEVKASLWSANPFAAPGNDGLTNLVYKHCWETLGEPLVEVVQAVHGGAAPTLSQRTF